MPSRKTLQGVARSLADSFTSLMNYRADDYVMGHLVRTAWATGATELRFDLLRHTATPSPLFAPPISDSVLAYADWLPQLVAASQSSMEFVCEAELLINVNPLIRRLGSAGLPESPYTCCVTIVDDRGKKYLAELSGFWYPEPPSTPHAAP